MWTVIIRRWYLILVSFHFRTSKGWMPLLQPQCCIFHCFGFFYYKCLLFLQNKSWLTCLIYSSEKARPMQWFNGSETIHKIAFLKKLPISDTVTYITWSSPSYDHLYFLCFHSPLLSFSHNNFSIHSSPPSFSTLILFKSSFSLVQKLHAPFSCAINSSWCSKSHYSLSHLINSESLKTLAVSLHASAYQPSSGIVVPILLKFSSFQSLFHKFQFYSFLSSLPILDRTICFPHSQLFYSSNNSFFRWPALPFPNFLFSSLSFFLSISKFLPYQP